MSRWTMQGRDANELLVSLEPYLIYRKLNAQVLIEEFGAYNIDTYQRIFALNTRNSSSALNKYIRRFKEPPQNVLDRIYSS